ncbi:MAG: hypothetical protein ACK8QZ_08895 [Anaerolineales bacterium]
MNKTTPAPDPKGWGDAGLTDFFAKSYENRKATFARFGAIANEHALLDLALRDFWSKLKNPKSRIVSDLLARSHLLFTSASEMAFSTQYYSSIVLCRTALETAAYGALMTTHPSTEPTWLARNDSGTKKKRARETFSQFAIKQSLGSFSTELQRTYLRLYETAIEFGAHANPMGIHSGSKVTPREQGAFVEQIGMTDNEDLIEFGLKISFDTGMCAAGIITYIFPDNSVDLSNQLQELLEKHNLRIASPKS